MTFISVNEKKILENCARGICTLSFKHNARYFLAMANIQENKILGKASVKSKESKIKIPELKLTDYMKECLNKVAIAEGFQNYKL